MRIACSGLLALIASCTTPNTTKACAAGSCADPSFPYCDVEGTISGEPGTCIAVSCAPGTIEACLGNDALTCNAAGDGYEHVACDVGCSTTPSPHCAYLEPRYLPDVCDAPASMDELTFTSSGAFDPKLDTNCTGGTAEQPGATSICIVRYQRITIPTGVTITVAGSGDPGGGRSVAFVADEQILIEGTLDVGARLNLNGPGGGVITSGGVGTGGVGSGGAGGRTNGAPGASYSADGGAANGGLAAADPALLAALVGGASAARVGQGDSAVGGGGGGGATTLIACRGGVSIAGTVNAGGAGGSAGFLLLGNAVSGFGGGAGGYVVLQGVSVSVTGKLFANGGGGGGGMQASTQTGERGQDGSLSDTTAAKGGFPQDGEGAGGSGGVGTIPPGSGKRPTTSPGSCGGGGGSVGFLQTYTPDGVEPTLTPTAVSPAFQPNATIKTR